MSWQPSVAVVVAAYNAERTIDECVTSLLALDYPADRLEVRVVDNGSSDSTLPALRRYRGRIIVQTERRRGPSAARNAGVAATAAEVVAFTDADCRVQPGWCSALVAALEDPKIGVAGGRILARDPANPIARFGEVIHDHRAAIEQYSPPYAITMNWGSRRSLLRAMGGFDERFIRTQDVDLSYRIVQAGYRLRFVPEAVVFHRNEETLAGLFREGMTHGFHGVRARKRHAAFLAELGHRQVNTRAYAELGAGVMRWARGLDDDGSRCRTVFNLGKKAGKLAGTVRFAHFDL
jgi:GT2 family glycosyltransferase